MANQPAQSRPWFRLSSIARPAPESIPTPVAAPEPAPVQARPVLARPALRPQPSVLSTLPQESTPAPPPSAATVAPPIAAPPPAAPVQVSPANPAGGGGVASVPSSPIRRPSAPTASLPTSPVQSATVSGPITANGSVQASPRSRVPAPTISSVPTSPVLKPAQTFSVPTSPVLRPAQTISVPTSPVLKTTQTSSVPTSPALKPSQTSSVPTSPALKRAQTLSVPTSPVNKPMPTPFAVPSSPTPKPSPKTSSVPASPTNKASPITTARVPSPVPSYARNINLVVESPPRSPKPNPTAPPPSPLLLPPAKLKSDAEPEPKIPMLAEQKTVLVQKTIDNPKPWTNSGSSDRIPEDAIKSKLYGHNGKQETSKDRHGETKEKAHHKKLSTDSEDGGMRIITIAGENKGAFMEVIHTPNNKKHVFQGHPHRIGNQPKGSSSSSSSSSSDGEGKAKMKKDGSHKGSGTNSLPLSAFMNSNVQGVNNSIVYNSSCTHHDPGVHLALSRKPAGAGGGFHIKDRSQGHHHHD
ncbi:vegetative cell wall protein gp1 [Mercurialis annua]|uniref:vegetative cell wall protein gp1 n=1 Tax=Mercurialis annua TaxID=3986 RepID=UPI00215F73AC|nr:vegetative cell wall protein gp1 [Mercurialis annua]